MAAAQGYEPEETARVLAAWNKAASDEDRQRLAIEHGAALVALRVEQAAPAVLVISPRGAIEATGGESLNALLRLAEMGLDLCAFRAHARHGRDGASQAAPSEQTIMPGFIHSSPAMTHLVEEIQKIRSSDVTVLVPGSPGRVRNWSHAPSTPTPRAAPKSSSRSTARRCRKNSPKPISSAIAGRGAFTGAVNDSPGVIRTAAAAHALSR